MSNTVTFAQLKKTLNDFGFQAKSSGSHVIFLHSKTGVVLTVPYTEGNVPSLYINTATRQVANSGIATVSTFQSRLQKSKNSGNN
jgi:predicted RNA binding protein YcfA (HicA-like mRNA interferase family)